MGDAPGSTQLSTAPAPTRADIDAALAAVDAHFDEFVAELQELCRFRSRRQEPEQMKATAEWLAESARRHGATADVIPWEHSHPYVLAEVPGGPKRLLHFTHYDVEVEPAGDDSEWVSGPYEAAIRDGALYARGVADDKGVIMSRLHAVAAWRLAGLTPPVTSVFIMEGKQMLHSPDSARSPPRTPSGSRPTRRCGRTRGATARAARCSSSPRRACSTCASRSAPCPAT
ncbi:M20/M25/M40 family metallo-hydrolase [Pseudonocardia benzenivorans]